MRNRKNNKRALIVSALSLLLCVSMLVGSTMAWFTDNATTGVNTIQAGTLDIQLLMQDKDGNWVDAENQTLEFIDMDDNSLWEPGCTYQLPTLKIVNNGNLALKFKMVINGLTGDGAKLAEVLDVGTIADGKFVSMDTTLAQLAADPDGAAYGNLTAKAESQAYPLALRMQTTAGNDYQGLALDKISITVMATQDTVESDSFDNQYDAGADFAPPIVIDDLKNVEADDTWFDADAEELVIADAADLKAYFETAYTWGVANKPDVPNFKGQTITLESDIYLNNELWTPISPYDSSFNGNGGFQGTFDGNGHTIYDLQVTNVNQVGRGYVLGLFGDVGDGAVFKNLTLDGVSTYAGNSNTGALVGIAHGNVTFENITVKNALIKQGRQAGGIVGQITSGNVTFTNCTVENSAVLTFHNDNQGPIYGYAAEGTTVTENNCTVTNVVEHKFTDWNDYQYITLAEALERFKDEPASNDT